ncbi:triose-phosphate isomerase [Candidatus Hecatella orcuttiae]|uniref:triose-phosphate isomerase n=1 Tax=Candidatus Hecatella orcuttiae TaxID=1935119 RepID=UPI0028680496|nr:triose-phosphate isomerase [Candidatus Hecatella orcuttiae]
MKLKLPAILVNFKCYREATGKQAVRLAEIAGEVSEETGVTLAVAPQFTDLPAVIQAGRVPVFSQHIDPVKPGSFTGHILAEAVKEAGASGSLVNHSERRLPLEDVKACVERAREVGLATVVCADTPQACGEIAAFNPDVIAIEPPELIGTGIPVSKAKPEVVTGALKAVEAVNPAVPVLCGAGITVGADVEAALKLGTRGVLLASGVVKAPDPRRVLVEMAEAVVRAEK